MAALENETKKVVSQFDFTDADLNVHVKEFLRQMGMLRPPPLPLPSGVRSSDNSNLFLPSATSIPMPKLTRLCLSTRRGLAERRYQHEPDPYLCHCSSQWHRKGSSFFIV